MIKVDFRSDTPPAIARLYRLINIPKLQPLRTMEIVFVFVVTRWNFNTHAKR